MKKVENESNSKELKPVYVVQFHDGSWAVAGVNNLEVLKEELHENAELINPLSFVYKQNESLNSISMDFYALVPFDPVGMPRLLYCKVEKMYEATDNQREIYEKSLKEIREKYHA